MVDIKELITVLASTGTYHSAGKHDRCFTTHPHIPSSPQIFDRNPNLLVIRWENTREYVSLLYKAVGRQIWAEEALLCNLHQHCYTKSGQIRKTAIFRRLKVWVVIGVGICNFAELIHVHEIYRLPSKKFKEYRESGFLELAFLDGFTGNITVRASTTVVFIHTP